MHLHQILITVLVSFVCYSVGNFAVAQVRQSTNYRIQSDSINIGGVYSSSTSYQLEDTTGEIATGESASASFSLKAGYQQMQESYLALTASADVVLSPSIGGLTGGTSNGSTSVTATTDNAAGYQLTISAENNPAMQKGVDSIEDYAPAGDPDFIFATSSTNAYFGYSPEGSDIVSRFKDNGSDTCNTGSSDTALACWDGLSTSDVVISQSASSNHPSGTETSVRFRVDVGGSVGLVPGDYIATTTLTLIAL